MKKSIENNILSIDSSLSEAMQALDKSPIGIVFFVDNSGRLKGILTDGDIRRAILKGADLKECVQNYMITDFVYGSAKAAREENLRLINDEIRHLPILDDDGRIVDFLSITDFIYFPVMEPSLTGNELAYVVECIKTNWISSQGSYVRRFERAFAEYLGIDYALTTSSGTTALHLALTALGIGPGDEVIVPDLTFAASASVVRHCGATPVLIDVHPDYWNLDPGLIEKAITPKTKAIMPVHLYGHPCDMGHILDVARKYRLYVVEDCAEALGAKYKSKYVGTFGDVGCFSFFSNKIITTGEGGMVVTQDKALNEKMMLYRDHGMRKNKRYWHEVAGFNYRMTNIQAAIGLAQMEQIESFLQKKFEIAENYASGLKTLPGISLPPEMDWARNVFWLYSVLIDESVTGISRDKLMLELQKEGIETRPFFYPLHQQPPFKQKSGNFAVSKSLSARGVSLPSSPRITADEIVRITGVIKKIIMRNLKCLQEKDVL